MEVPDFMGINYYNGTSVDEPGKPVGRYSDVPVNGYLHWSLPDKQE